MSGVDYVNWAQRLDNNVAGYTHGVIDGISPPMLYSLVAVALVGVLIFGRLMMQNFAGKAPPVFEGVPFIGGILKFAKGPLKLMNEGYAKCGEVFTVPVMHKNITFLIGPHVSPHFFKANDDQLSQEEVYKFNVPTFGPGVVFDVNWKIRSEQIRFFADSLRTERLKGYVPQFTMEIEAFFAKWGDSGVVDLNKELTELIILTASRTLMGREVREEMFDQVSSLLHDLDDGMRPISVFFPYLPIAAHRKRDAVQHQMVQLRPEDRLLVRARVELARLFSKVIERRRESGEKGNDVLQTFIDSKYRTAYNGRATTNEEIAGFLIATLFAGQHTSSITSAWTGYSMLHTKDRRWATATEEQRQIVEKHGEAISMEALADMGELHANIQEAVRLFPPLILVMRYVRESFSVADSAGRRFVIPKGNIVMASPAFSHRLPSVFKEPDQYQPERFLPPREEEKARPYSYIGFGGGRHACLGQNFAYLQIKAIWSHLLRNFDMDLVDDFPDPDYQSMVVGPKPCRIRYRRCKL